MKANVKSRERFIADRKGFTFIIPLTMAIVVGFSLLVIGAYVVGSIGSALEDSYPTNVASGSADTTVFNNRTGTTTAYSTSITLPTDVSNFNNAVSKFYIFENGTALDYDLNVNGQMVNTSSNLTTGDNAGWNTTFAYLLTNNSVNNTDRVINFQWNITSANGVGQVSIRYYVASYFVSGDYRSSGQNSTITLIGNVTDGFSDVVDIEVVVIIITVLTMALLAIMAIGSRRQLF